MRIAIVGGGYAGLSAAVELCVAGLQPIVFEATGTLGGRARRVEVEGRTLDNGLHILIGAYRETLRLMGLVSPAGAPVGLLRMPLELRIPGHFSLQAGRLPAPWHLLQGLLGARGLSMADKWGIARLMLTLQMRRHPIQPDLPLEQFLRSQRQSARASKMLWEPLCIAALNTQPEEASTQIFATVLRDTFAPPASNADLLLPTTDFSRLFPEPAAAFVHRHGGEVRMGCRVLGIRQLDDGARIVLRDGEERFDAVILAVAPQHLAALTQEESGLAPTRAMIGQFTYRPIHSIYLGYPADIRLPRPMLGMAARYAQWVFDRGQLCQQPGCLGVVISADGAHQNLLQAELASAVHAELSATFPGLPAPLWHRVIAEKRATIASTAGLRRPSTRTPCARIFLAGDYVESGYPATLEAAVRSGIAAARLAIQIQ